MFLAFNELRKEKSRFILITIVIVLVGYLTYFLTGLAYGLAKSYTRGLEEWQANGIILNVDANNNIARSLITEKEYASLVGDDAALLGTSTATVIADTSDDVAVFGIEKSGFFQPNIVEGEAFTDVKHVVVSDAFKKIGVKLGSELKFKGVESTYQVSGFTGRATFQTAPIIYMDMAEWRQFAANLSGMTGMRNQTTVNALVTRAPFNPDVLDDPQLQWQKIQDYYFELPGYRPQVLTFSLMIGFLIAIASFVLAIFMYILTLQKKNIFGVLKAEGVPNSYIARSVLIQAILLTVAGLLAGALLTMISVYFLKGKVPFLVNPWFFSGIFGLFLVCTLFGSLASVRAVTKIDPIKAIG